MPVRIFRPIRLRENRYSDVMRSISEEAEPHRTKFKNAGLLCLMIGCFLILAIPVATSAKAHFSAPVVLGCLATLFLLAALVLLALSKAAKRWKNQFYHEIDSNSRRSSNSGSKKGCCKGSKISAAPTTDITPYPEKAATADNHNNISSLQNYKTAPVPVITNGHSNSVISAPFPPQSHMDLQMIDEEVGIGGGVATPDSFRQRINLDLESQEARDRISSGPDSAKTNSTSLSTATVVVQHSSEFDPSRNTIEVTTTKDGIRKLSSGSGRDIAILCHEVVKGGGGESESFVSDDGCLREAVGGEIEGEDHGHGNEFENFASMHRSSVSSNRSSQRSQSSKASKSRRSSRTGLGSQESIGIPKDFMANLGGHRSPPVVSTANNYTPLETLYSVDDRINDGGNNLDRGVRIPAHQHPIDFLINSQINNDHQLIQEEQEDNQMIDSPGSKYSNNRSGSGRSSGDVVNDGVGGDTSRLNGGRLNDNNNNNDHDNNSDVDSNEDGKCKSTGDEFERFFEAANRISPNSSIRRASSSRQYRRDRSPRTGLGSTESVGLTVTQNNEKYRKFSMDNFLSIPSVNVLPTPASPKDSRTRKGSHPVLHNKFLNYSSSTTAKDQSSPDGSNKVARRASLNTAIKPKNKF